MVLFLSKYIILQSKNIHKFTYVSNINNFMYIIKINNLNYKTYYIHNKKFVISINLTNNSLKEIPNALPPNIKYLSLAINSIIRIPKILPLYLESLSLYSNNIIKIPNSLFKLNYIKNIDIEYNKLLYKIKYNRFNILFDYYDIKNLKYNSKIQFSKNQLIFV